MKKVSSTLLLFSRAGDFDGLELDADMKLRLASMNSGGGSVEERRMTMYEVMAHISLAIEADVARATSLAKDLNIARPPLVVKAPTACKAQQEALHHNSSPAHGNKFETHPSLFSAVEFHLYFP